MSLGKLTNAFLQASQETTLALANLNFNFTLIKFDAPAEYQGLGNRLSLCRKQAAEDGSVHVVARKLTALFQGVIPPVPNLIQAYGSRASEIAESPHVNPQGDARQGIFADHVGADGMSIWASATSGKNAVAMHLLACMLARIWQREQAVPIWMELVEQRQSLLRASFETADGTMSISDLTASHIELSRSEVDQWDSSARAWLQTADAGQCVRQTQLRLIVDNISLPVSSSNNIYTAITDAWTHSMQALENLIAGAPQRIVSGAILLGLSAWHLYPDILLAGQNRVIKQSDPLINPGGIVTIGLQNATEDNKGVVWSLPLSHSRYYGHPVITTRHAGLRESQVTYEEFMLVVVGTVIASWGTSHANVDDALDLITILANAAPTKNLDLPPIFLSKDAINRTAATSGELRCFKGENLWIKCLRPLARAAAYYKSASGIERQNLARLIKYGQRNYAKFLVSRNRCPAPVFGLAEFPRLLWCCSEQSDMDRVAVLHKWAARELGENLVAHAIIRYREDSTAKFQYAKVSDRSKGIESQHKRQWVEGPLGEDVQESPGPDWDSSNRASYEWRHKSNRSEEIPLYPLDRPGGNAVPHTFICGDPSAEGIYIPSFLLAKTPVENNCLSVSQLLRCFTRGDISPKCISKALFQAFLSNSSSTAPYFESLRAIAAASQIYAGLEGARMDLQSISSPVINANWWKSMRGGSADPKLEVAMSCIAYFETGCVDVMPLDLSQDTIAVCHATSIFVASRLLIDPIDDISDHVLQRITGNVGMPGLSFLVTPPDPKMRPIDASSWRVINHDKYDGKKQNSFRSTSFHLSFTGFTRPLGVVERSGRDFPACLRETAVSVYDKGQWVADLDILAASRQWSKAQPANCRHVCEKQSAVPDLSLVSVDSWLELLEPPQESQHAVVRASGDPIARLAAASLAIQKGYEVVIIPDKVCWQCDWPSLAKGGPDSPGLQQNLMSNAAQMVMPLRVAETIVSAGDWKEVGEEYKGEVGHTSGSEEEATSSSSSDLGGEGRSLPVIRKKALERRGRRIFFIY